MLTASMEETAKKRHRPYFALKRVLDIFFSLLFILVLSPILLIVLILNAFASKGHPLFVQLRSGKNDKPFKIVKFRTMKMEVPSYVTSEELGTDNELYFRFGFFLKRTHLDELPQLFNIFAGQMSFVGPRPGLTTQTDLIEYRKANGSIALTPGLTGLAQVSVGNDGPLTQLAKSELDKVYLDRISLWFDIKIFFKTFGKVFGNMKARKKKGKNSSKSL